MAAIVPGKFAILLLSAFLLVSGQQEDRSFLDEINLARTSPQTYAELLRDRFKLYDGKVLRLPGETPLLTHEGVAAAREAATYLDRATPVTPLTWSRALALAAQDHAADIGKRGALSHRSRNGDEPETRMKRRGSDATLVGENISFGPSGAREVVLDLLIDDGVKSRGHRTNLMSADFQGVGVACAKHTRYGTVCVLDLSN